MSLRLAVDAGQMSTYSPVLAFVCVATPALLPRKFAIDRDWRLSPHAKKRVDWVMPVLTASYASQVVD